MPEWAIRVVIVVQSWLNSSSHQDMFFAWYSISRPSQLPKDSDNGLPTSLRCLQILCCPALQCLPDSGLPSSLSHLNIDGCLLLKKRCQRETREDWPKIAHIKCIYINFKRI